MSFDDVDLARLRASTAKKWRTYGEGVLPAWIADQDFPPPEPIRNFVAEAGERGDLGYPMDEREALAEVFAERAHTRYGWRVDPERVELVVDVVQGLYWGLELYSERGDGAIIQTPIYPPFLSAVRETGRRGVLNRMVGGDGELELDLDRLRRDVDSSTRVMMLCNPHNPSGRVLSRGELEQLGEIALANDLVVFADEIHADLLFDGRSHIPFASLAPELERRTVTFHSATKAFNTAGLRCAVAAFGGEALHERFRSVPRRMFGGPDRFGAAVTRIAWQRCDEWLAALVRYLEGNRDFLAEFLASRVPGIAFHPPQATYLAWLDCRALGLPVEPYEFFLEHAEVAMSEGLTFGEDGRGHARLNFATPRSLLGEILERMAAALERRPVPPANR